LVFDFVDFVVCPRCVKIGDLENIIKDDGEVNCPRCGAGFYVYELERTCGINIKQTVYKSSTKELCSSELELVEILSYHDVLGRA
jgi:predicted nucleic acid-binding Zn ribbon protein